MEISAQTDIMLNQKQATIMAADKAFTVLQTKDGDSLFFSIGTDPNDADGSEDVLYVTRELRNGVSTTGWDQVDLSSRVSPGKHVGVSSFAMAQNVQTLAFDLIIVASVNYSANDTLFISSGHKDVPADWANGVSWAELRFDAVSVDGPKITPPNPLKIADVFLMNISNASGTSVLNCFVDIIRDPLTSTTKALDRYYIDLAPSASPAWNRHLLALDIAAGSVQSCLGRREKDAAPGIYTFGTIGGDRNKQLLYIPQYVSKQFKVAPRSARLQPPKGSTSIASAATAAGYTNLFVSGDEGLWVFDAKNQTEAGVAVLAVPALSIAGQNVSARLRNLSAATVGSTTSVWGLNAQNDLIYTSCPAGRETKPASWSSPVPIMSGVQNFAFFLNKSRDEAHVLFAHIGGELLRKISQDPVTATWSSYEILLPSPDVKQVVEYDSFTSHITVWDSATGQAASDVSVDLTATAEVPVSVNDVHHVLYPGEPVRVKTSLNGTVTVIQAAPSLSQAVTYSVTVTSTGQAGKTVIAIVDPLEKANERMRALQSGEDVTNATAMREDGTRYPLVDGGVSKQDKDAMAQALQQMLEARKSLPADGSKASSTTATVAASSGPSLVAARALATAQISSPQLKPFAVTFHKDGTGAFFHHGAAAQKVIAGAVPIYDTRHEVSGRMAISSSSTALAAKVSPLAPLPEPILHAAGDLSRLIKKAGDALTSFACDAVGQIYRAVVWIGEKIYHAYLDCKAALDRFLDMVWDWIKVAWEKLKAFLDDLFVWPSILRTHRVFKTVMNNSLDHLIDSIVDAEETVADKLDDMTKRVQDWAGLKDKVADGSTVGFLSKSASSGTKDTDSPKANWVLQHLTSALSGGISSGDDKGEGPGSMTGAVLKAFQEALQNLLELIEEEAGGLANAALQANEVARNINNMRPEEAGAKILGIIAELVLRAAKHLVVKILDVGRIIVGLIKGVVNAPIRIKVISPLYEQLVGSPLSLLDLICLVAAVPATIVYKLVTSNTLYPDDAHTAALIGARSNAEMRALVIGSGGRKQAKMSFATAAARQATSSDSEWPVRLENPPEEEEDDYTQGQPYIKACFALNILGGSAGLAQALLKQRVEMLKAARIEADLPLTKLELWCNRIGNACSFGLLASNAPYVAQGGWSGLNTFCAVLTLIKSVVDMTGWGMNSSWGVEMQKLRKGWDAWGSGVADGVINTLWLLPAFGSFIGTAEEDRTASGTVNFIACLCLDASGMTGFLNVKKVDVKIKAIAIASGILLLAVGSGTLMLGGWINLMENEDELKKEK